MALCPYYWSARLKRYATNVSRILFRRLSWYGVRFVRMLGHSPIPNRLPATYVQFRIFRGSLYIIESRTREFSFKTSDIRATGRRTSHLNRIPLVSRLFTRSENLKRLHELRLIIIRNEFLTSRSKTKKS